MVISADFIFAGSGEQLDIQSWSEPEMECEVRPLNTWPMMCLWWSFIRIDCYCDAFNCKSRCLWSCRFETRIHFCIPVTTVFPIEIFMQMHFECVVTAYTLFVHRSWVVFIFWSSHYGCGIPLYDKNQQIQSPLLYACFSYKTGSDIY